MERFELPHWHGEKNAEGMHKRASDIAKFNSVADVFKQLSDITRLRIFWILSHDEECVINIAAMLDMSSPAVSHHLRIMCDSGLLVSRRDGKEVYYSAANSDLCGLLHDGIEQIMDISCPQKAISSGATDRDIAESVHEYLSEHISERITIEELSRHFLINPTSLKRVFKETYGDSIAAHTRQHRIELAARLLEGGKMSVSDVAGQVGYESQSKFSLAFKEAYGVLPSEYRKKRSNNSEQLCEMNSSANNIGR